ncbi:tRNA1(Val) (adenine(37)-N6)-methyltransferase [Dysgonomonas macrotermitis]|uniref:tRNA1(Val) (adenine(37)-N6)-methyltransferase n=1 Tax=Dysgonomonas macrotermitis TaxID=1346286 RepID=A0A1M5H2J4_9BACT|nr:methyltransferase [Dysgonomonas macrotermitis]SHG10217.1 tRNA1Val (adenine37-N6)-methyltransferase [Dysgonomonas macrotermitis]
MANSYFRFKQFTVYQDKCAMKVGTDGVLLGGWADINDARTILDVGTGTGLIAMMLSQRAPNPVSVDAIDIDMDAVCQAKENVQQSGFFNIKCEHASLAEFVEETGKRYDLIVSNPPYFISSLHSPDSKRTVARHTDSLPVADFIRLSVQILSDNGRISMIFPFSEKELLLSLAEKEGLSVTRITNVRPTPGASYKRVLLELSKCPAAKQENELLIEVSRHQYSPEFMSLLSDFYLAF